MQLHHIQLSLAQMLIFAGVAYGALQSFKRAGLQNFLSPRLMVGFNFGFAFVGTIAIAGNLSLNTLFLAVAAALAAAGIHATGKVLYSGSLSGPSPAPSASSVGKIAPCIALLFVCLIPLAAFSCGAWDQTAYETLAVTKAVVDTAATDYASGVILGTSATYTAITKAQAAQTAAVEAIETYEVAKAAAATSPTVLQADLNAAEAALGNIGPVLAAVEALDPAAAAKDTAKVATAAVPKT